MTEKAAERLERARRNADVGYIYYQQQVDAQGYPNGMPFWEEIPPGHQYHHTVTALHLVRALAEAGMIRVDPEKIGLSKESQFGSGDCLLLMDELERRWPSGREELNKRIAAVQRRDPRDEPEGEVPDDRV